MDNFMSAFTFTDVNEDWHDDFSIKLGELVDEEFDPFGDPLWKDADWFSDEQRERLQTKFLKHYRHYEIGITPPLVWRDMLTAKIIEIMPKYKAAYQKIANGQDIFAASDEYGKSRAIFSDFPSTQLAPDNQDYASNATDNQYEKVLDGDWFDKMQLIRDYNDIDVMIINECGVMFSCLATTQTPW
jgi:hypothetical protein